MGSGKSSWAMKYINDCPEKRFIYVTPFLDEVERCCIVTKSEQPEKIYGNKIESFKRLISQNYNIATTHELFKNMDNECIDILKNSNYTLILDEVLDVVEETTLAKGDIENLLSLKILKEENGNLVCGDLNIVKDKSNTINEYQHIAINLLRNNLEIINGDKKIALLWLFPIDLLDCFEEVYMMTFCFDGYPINGYLKINGYEIKKYSIVALNTEDKYENRIFKLCDYKNHNTEKFKKLINIIDNGRVNEFGEKDNSLTFSWWNSRVTDKYHIDWINIKKSINNILNNYTSSKSKNRILWTCFQNTRSSLYTKILDDENFVAHNIRATNKYKDRVVIIYLINRKYNPVIKNWLKSKAVLVNEEMFSLGELIQLVWRTAIREGKEIDLYIPSRRMREILANWLNGE